MDEVQRLIDAAGAFRGRNPTHFQAECYIVLDGHVREERVALKYDAETPLAGTDVRDIFAVKQDASIGRSNETSDHLQHGRLPAARRT